MLVWYNLNPLGHEPGSSGSSMISKKSLGGRMGGSNTRLHRAPTPSQYTWKGNVGYVVSKEKFTFVARCENVRKGGETKARKEGQRHDVALIWVSGYGGSEIH